MTPFFSSLATGCKTEVDSMYRAQDEREWMAAYRAWEADRAFRGEWWRSSWDALVRAAAPRARRAGSASGELAARVTSCRDVPLVSIVGVLGSGGARRLPRLRKRQKETWRRLFLAEETPTPRAPLTAGPGGWLLGDPSDALFVAVARSRGARTVRAVTIDAPAATARAEDTCCPPPRKIA
jgi:hypothetical protein